MPIMPDEKVMPVVVMLWDSAKVEAWFFVKVPNEVILGALRV